MTVHFQYWFVAGLIGLVLMSVSIVFVEQLSPMPEQILLGQAGGSVNCPGPGPHECTTTADCQGIGAGSCSEGVCSYEESEGRCMCTGVAENDCRCRDSGESGKIGTCNASIGCLYQPVYLQDDICGTGGTDAPVDPQAPICGNSIPEPGEECDGGAGCCMDQNECGDTAGGICRCKEGQFPDSSGNCVCPAERPLRLSNGLCAACTTHSQCDDENSCTLDACVNGSCKNEFDPAKKTDPYCACPSPETQQLCGIGQSFTPEQCHKCAVALSGSCNQPACGSNYPELGVVCCNPNACRQAENGYWICDLNTGGGTNPPDLPPDGGPPPGTGGFTGGETGGTGDSGTTGGSAASQTRSSASAASRVSGPSSSNSVGSVIGSLGSAGSRASTTSLRSCPPTNCHENKCLSIYDMDRGDGIFIICLTCVRCESSSSSRSSSAISPSSARSAGSTSSGLPGRSSQGLTPPAPNSQTSSISRSSVSSTSQNSSTSSTSSTSQTSSSSRTSSTSQTSSSSRTSSTSRSSTSQTSSSSPVLIGGLCLGTECELGGDDFCGIQKSICRPTDSFPCIVCGDTSSARSSASFSYSLSSLSFSKVSSLSSAVSPPFITSLPSDPDNSLDPSLITASECSLDAPCGTNEFCVANECLSEQDVFLLPPFCGNARRDKGEQCDEGSLNSDRPNALCRPDCTIGRCGDTIRDTPLELCDDGNTANNDGCSSLCQTERGAPTETLPATVIELPLTTIIAGVPLHQQNPTYHVPPKNPDTGPAALALMIAGASAGYAWMRRKRQ